MSLITSLESGGGWRFLLVLVVDERGSFSAICHSTPPLFTNTALC